MTKANGILCMITQQSWMFLSSYEVLRRKIYNDSILTMAHLGSRAFDDVSGEMVSTTAFSVRKRNVPGYKGNYVRLVKYQGEHDKEQAFFDYNNHYIASQTTFGALPGVPVAYWVSERVSEAFLRGSSITKYADTFQGIVKS